MLKAAGASYNNEKAKTATRAVFAFCVFVFKNGDRPIVGMHHGASAIRIQAANSLIIGCTLGSIPTCGCPDGLLSGW